MAKRGSPALYELIRARGPEQAVPPTQTAHPSHTPVDDEVPLPGGWLRPGRMLHLPLGYVFISVATAIVVAMVMYMAGYSRGKSETRHIGAGEAEQYVASTAEIPRDPLETRVNTGQNAPPTEREPRRETKPPSRQWGPTESDPRQAGMNYLILMETRRAGAERLIEFARERGLETYMVPANNTFFRIFALPGFDSVDSSEAVAFREEVLRRVGEPWRQQERARDNPLGSSYWSLYRPGG